MNKCRAVAAAAALLLILLLGAANHGEEPSEERVQPSEYGSTAQEIKASDTLWTERGKTYGEIFTGRISRSLSGSGGSFLAAESSAVQGSLGSGKEDSTGEPGGLGNSAEEAASPAPGNAESLRPSGSPVLTGADYRGVFTITAYTAGYESTQKKPGQEGYGITYSGTTVKEGRTIAADLTVLPVGTRVYIEGVGERTVEDKGGGVKGQHIDLYIADLDEAQDWGKQSKKLYVIEWGKTDND